MFRRDSPFPLVCSLAGFGLALRVAVGFFLPHHSWVSDELEYLGASKMAAAGFGLGFYEAAPWLRPPGYIAFLAALFRAGGSEGTAYVLQSIFLSAATVAIMLVAWEAWGKAAAIGAGLFTNVYYPWLVYPNLLLTESLCIFLVSWGAWLALRKSAAGSLGAGATLGLAALTRGLAGALALPLALYQFVSGKWRHAVLLLIVWGAVQAPWVLRNYTAYGALAQPDLTAGFNLWFAAEGLRNEARLVKELSSISNPIERDRYAQGKAVRAILADPWHYLERGLKEVGDLWLPNFAGEERLVSGFTLGEVPPWHLALNFFLGDLLFAVSVGLALVGLAAQAQAPAAKLSMLWIAFLTGVAFFLFATDRFRMLAVVPVATLAANGIATLTHHGTYGSRRKAGLAAMALAVPLVATLSAYPFDLMVLGATRWWAVQQLGEVRWWLRHGEVTRATLALRSMDDSFVEARLLKVQARALSGQPGIVPQTASGATDLEAMAVGDLWRYLGRPDRAEQFFSSPQVAYSDRVDWAWGRSLSPPPSAITVGNGMDIGFIKGFSKPERDGTKWFRWTRGRAEMVLSAPSMPSRIIVEMAAYRPSGWLPVPVKVEVNEKPIWEGQVAWPWQQIVADVEGPGPLVHVVIRSDTFVPGFQDRRQLGVMVSEVKVVGR